MKPLYRHLVWIIFYLFLAGILLANSFSYLDPDFGWHLRAGEEVFNQKDVPRDQIYMWTLDGKTWVDHEWLSDALTYGLWLIGGYGLITAFFILIPLLAVLLLNIYIFKHYIQRTAGRLVFAAAEAFAIIACLPHFGVRMQEFSFLGTVILFIIIDSCRRRQKSALAFWLIPLIYMWACLHAGFLFGVAIVIGWFIYETLLLFVPRFKKIIHEKNISLAQWRTLLLIIIITIGATLFTPYGTELYTFLADYGKNTYYISHIQEWRSPYTSPFAYPQIIYSIIMVAAAINLWVISKRRPPLWQMVILIGLLGLASKSVRHFPLWAAGSLIFLIPTIITQEINQLRIPRTNSIGLTVFACSLALTIQLVLGARYTAEPFFAYCDFYPCDAVRFLKNNPDIAQKKMFNDYGWGGYFIAMMPEKKLFIDGRLPQYDFNNHTALEEFNEFFQKEKIKNKLDEHGIELVFIKASEKKYEPDWVERTLLGYAPSERRNPLLEHLKSSDDWRKIYDDGIAVLYERK